MRPALAGLAGAWQRFWFAPQSTATLGLVRIAFGSIAVLWFLSLLPMLAAFFGPDAVLVEHPRMTSGSWSVLAVIGGHTGAVVVFWAVCVIGAVSLTVGYRTRIAAVVVFVGLVSFTRQMPIALNGGDLLLRLLAVYMVLAPAGAALSLDRRRRAPDRFWECPAGAPWVLRLMQVQLSVIYLSTVWEKVTGGGWTDGTALSYALRLGDLQRLPVPAFVTDTPWLVGAMTLGTLGLEFAIAILVWNRWARPWVLALGVLLHLSIDMTITVGFFSAAMLVLYLAFLPPGTADRLVARVRDRFARRRERHRGTAEHEHPTVASP